MIWTIFREDILLLAQNHLLYTIFCCYIGYVIDKIHNIFIDLLYLFTMIKQYIVLVILHANNLRNYNSSPVFKVHGVWWLWTAAATLSSTVLWQYTYICLLVFQLCLESVGYQTRHRVLLLCRSFILVGYLVYHVHLVEILNTCSMYKYARNGKLKKKM